MIEPTLALQKGIRAALIADDALASIVTPNSIFDGRSRPEAFPCVIIGEGQSVLESVTYSRKHARLHMSIHIWTHETGSGTVKKIAAMIAGALRAHPVIEGHALIDFGVTGCQFMRDPANEYGHAIVRTEGLVELDAPPVQFSDSGDTTCTPCDPDNAVIDGGLF